MTSGDLPFPDLPFGRQASGAVMSPNGLYRFVLWRRWAPAPPTPMLGMKTVPDLVFVMANPSSADATEDDPTIRRCIAFARRERAGGIRVVNLFAWRCTDPRELPPGLEAVGDGNDTHIAREAGTGRVVVAWGSVSKRAMHRAEAVAAMLRRNGVAMVCLGTNRDGAPKHPLYLRGDAPLQTWKGYR